MSDKIKEQAKELEELGLLEDIKKTLNNFDILQAMFYCYLEPVSKLLNKNFKTSLESINKSTLLQSFTAFQKGEPLASASVGAAKGKDIKYEDKEAVLLRLNKG